MAFFSSNSKYSTRPLILGAKPKASWSVGHHSSPFVALGQKVCWVRNLMPYVANYPDSATTSNRHKWVARGGRSEMTPDILTGFMTRTWFLNIENQVYLWCSNHFIVNFCNPCIITLVPLLINPQIRNIMTRFKHTRMNMRLKICGNFWFCHLRMQRFCYQIVFSIFSNIYGSSR